MVVDEVPQVAVLIRCLPPTDRFRILAGFMARCCPVKFIVQYPGLQQLSKVFETECGDGLAVLVALNWLSIDEVLLALKVHYQWFRPVFGRQLDGERHDRMLALFVGLIVEAGVDDGRIGQQHMDALGSVVQLVGEGVKPYVRNLDVVEKSVFVQLHQFVGKDVQLV